MQFHMRSVRDRRATGLAGWLPLRVATPTPGSHACSDPDAEAAS